MKTISALDLRARVGQYLDEAAAGERIVVERGGQPLCAIVPLADVDRFDPERVRERRLAALEEIRRFAKLHPAPPGFDSAALIRQMREERTEQIIGNTWLGRGARATDAAEDET